MHRRAGAFDVAQHKKVKPLNLVARPRRFAQKFQAGSHAGLALKAADGDALTQLIPAVIFKQGSNNGFQRHAMQRIARLHRLGLHYVGLCCLGHLFFSLPRSGTWVTTVGRTASGDTDLGGDVSFFGFLTILPLFC